jgi:hypothetical protein
MFTLLKFTPCQQGQTAPDCFIRPIPRLPSFTPEDAVHGVLEAPDLAPNLPIGLILESRDSLNCSLRGAFARDPAKQVLHFLPVRHQRGEEYFDGRTLLMI